MEGLFSKIKIFIKDKVWLGSVNKFLFGPKKKRLDLVEMNNPINGIKVYEVIPETKSTLIIDAEILALSNVSEIREYNPQHSISPVYIADIKNGRLMTDGSDVAIMSSERLLLENFSVHYSYGYNPVGGRRTFGSQKQEQNNLYNQKYYYPPTMINGTVLNMQTGGAGENYCHFLFDMLPGYYLAEKSGLLKDIDYYYFQTIEKKFHIDILTALNINKDKVITNHDTCHIKANRLLTFTHPNQRFHIPVWIIDFLRSTFLKMIVPDKNQFPRIFISRKDSAAGRQIINEDEIVAKLAPLGFKRIILSEYSFLDQVKIFNSAEVIISAHGAGLANLVFCNPNTFFIEIFNTDFITPLFHCLSKRISLIYSFMITASYKSTETIDAGYSSIFIDEELLFKKLKQILKLT